MEPLTPSRPVEGQEGLHPRLAEIVRRHLAQTDLTPIPDHSRRAFEKLQNIVGDAPNIVFDSGCGTGESTLALAERYPELWVVGIDKSADRLERGRRPHLEPQPGTRALWMRADVTAVWTMAVTAGWRLQRHFLMYPNPWPKKRHLQRRWHGHPAFASLVRLGGRLELRTNWRVYAEETTEAIQIAGGTARYSSWAGENITHFERKYRQSGHRLWRVQADLP